MLRHPKQSTSDLSASSRHSAERESDQTGSCARSSSISATRNPHRAIGLGLAALIGLGTVGLIQTEVALTQSEPTPMPRLAPIVVFPDFASVPRVDVKKQQFFDFLEPYVVAEIERLEALRTELQPYAAVVESGVRLSPHERSRVLELAQLYRIDPAELSEAEIVKTLVRRVDALPVSLALAQAANESAWGTSRFTLEGYNLFGMWCYEAGCGIVPRRRRAGASHEVQEFATVAEAVRAYFHNINTHPSYRNLRALRLDMRAADAQLNALELAAALGDYSERGENYIDEVQTLIKQNNLLERDALAVDG